MKRFFQWLFGPLVQRMQDDLLKTQEKVKEQELIISHLIATAEDHNRALASIALALQQAAKTMHDHALVLNAHSDFLEYNMHNTKNDRVN